jgi:hypothetical protein
MGHQRCRGTFQGTTRYRSLVVNRAIIAAGSLLFSPDRAIEDLQMRYTPLETALAEAVEEIKLRQTQVVTRKQ